MRADTEHYSTRSSDFIHHMFMYVTGVLISYSHHIPPASKPRRAVRQGSAPLRDTKLSSSLCLRWCPITRRHDRQPRLDADCGKAEPQTECVIWSLKRNKVKENSAGIVVCWLRQQLTHLDHRRFSLKMDGNTTFWPQCWI